MAISWGKKTASLRHPVWSMMDGTLKHSPWFSTAQDLGPGTHLTYVDWKRRCASWRVPEKAAEFLPVPAIWVGLKMFKNHWYSSYNGKQLRGLSCSWQLCLSKRLQMFPDSRSYNFVDKTHGWNGHGSKQNPQIGRTYIYSGSENGFSQ
jgi:hypothetical protein